MSIEVHDWKSIIDKNDNTIIYYRRVESMLEVKAENNVLSGLFLVMKTLGINIDKEFTYNLNSIFLTDRYTPMGQCAMVIREWNEV